MTLDQIITLVQFWTHWSDWDQSSKTPVGIVQSRHPYLEFKFCHVNVLVRVELDNVCMHAPHLRASVSPRNKNMKDTSFRDTTKNLFS